ncbi:UDP-glucose 4-epimerase [Thiosulfatimonas sediminis]|uniref:UDP-glucose 4-epimerase n=1 Tax=Thiosulfatimonas sediminis TaxID=2675054 RepID=A0A6F8PT58_9GAMM|nr:SDR family oxidoreductase [Thiosulfatimonas sediminis]BBP45276.1 UDP-glucose 4-epimerase [Thiosulfatimonas sediminis]
MKKMKVILTGSTGFVGASVLKKLEESEHHVDCLVRSQQASLSVSCSTVVADLTHLSDANSLEPLLSSLADCDVVVHCAARAHIMKDEAVDPLDEYRRVNRDATLMLAQMAAEQGVKRFVFVSSIKVNGEFSQPNQRFIPDVIAAPTDPYGLSKYEAEQGLKKISDETGMEVVIIRPPLVYGPGVKGNFASMIRWVKKGVPLPLGLVKNFRSLVAVENLADFISLCANRHKSPKAANEVFLISDGEDISTSDLLRKVAKAYGVKARLLPIPVGLMKFFAQLFGKGSVADRLFGNLQVDSTKARDLLGWVPVISMDDQLQKIVNFEKEKGEK